MTQAFTGPGEQFREKGEHKEADPYLFHSWPVSDDSNNDRHTHGLRTVRAQQANLSHHCHALGVKREGKKLQDVIMLALQSPGT